jgi:hypothetical protein
MFTRIAAAALSALVISVPSAVFAADTSAKEPGDLWETTTEMTGMGMSMPSRTSRHCAPREWKEPPGADDNKECQTTSFQTVGNKSTWTIRCTGRMQATGRGEVTRTADGYTGLMTMTMPQGEMTMKMTGRRLGDCDGAETKRDIKRMQDTAASAQVSAMAAQCTAALASMSLQLLVGPNAICKDPGAKGQFCDRLATQEGFELSSSRNEIPGDGIEAAASYCGTSAAKIQGDLCSAAAKSDSADSLDYLGKSCPDLAAPIAQKECAGRKYTEMTGSKYQRFCYQYARDLMVGGANEQPAPDGARKKKSLKDLFKR